jgi:hypothetical protein
LTATRRPTGARHRLTASVGFSGGLPALEVKAISQRPGPVHNMGGMVISSALHSTSQLFVAPDNGDPLFRSQTSVWGNDANLLNPGHWTYVLFDPDRPDHCDIDRARLLKEFGPRRDGDHRLAIPKDVSDEWFKSMRAAGRLSDAEFADARPATAPSTQG